MQFLQKIPLIMSGRRPGDAEIVYASTSKAEKELNWKYVIYILYAIVSIHEEACATICVHMHIIFSHSYFLSLILI